MTDDAYKQAMDTAVQELSNLMEERENLDDRRDKITRRINSLRDGIYALSEMLGEDPSKTRPELFPNLLPPDTGLTEAVREVLKSLDSFASTVDIKETLQERGFNIGKYRNPLSTIHQVLGRLIESGHVEKHEDEEKKLYRWKKQIGGTRMVHMDAGESTLERARRLAAEEEKKKLIEAEADKKVIQLTDGVLTILKSTDLELTPAEIREGLETLGFNIKGYSDFGAIVDAIWKTVSGIVKRTDKNDKVTYRLMTEEEKKKRDEEILKRVERNKKNAEAWERIQKEKAGK